MGIIETESASFWMNVLDDLGKRGATDILIVCSDNLKSLTQAIKAVFPETVTQSWIVTPEFFSFQTLEGFWEEIRKEKTIIMNEIRTHLHKFLDRVFI